MTTVTPMHCDLESNKNHPLVVLPAKSRSEQRQHVFGSGPLRVFGAVRKKLRLSAGQMLRGLRALEGNGLVRFVKEGRRRCPVMEIVDRLPHGDLKQ